jgi:hypothetical protein
MRPANLISSLFICVITFVSSCSEKEPEFVCTTNTQSTSGDGKKNCGISKITSFSKSGNEETMRAQIAGGYEVIMYNVTAFQEGTPYAPYSITYPNANRHISNSLTFVKIDRTAKTITFKYRFENEIIGGVNGTAIIVNDGQATDLIYQ